jgi:hypothetical protein
MQLTSESVRFRSADWIHRSRSSRDVFELELDGLRRDMGRRGGLILDREGLEEALRTALGPEAVIEEMRAVDLFRYVRRVIVRVEGLSIPLGRPALRRLLAFYAGDDWPVEEMPLTELLDRVSGVEVTAEGAPGWLDEPVLFALLGRGIAQSQRYTRQRDEGFERREAFRRQYERVLSAVRQAEREGAGTKDYAEYVHERAFQALAPDDQRDLAPLLDLQVEMDRELERTTFRSMTRAERIAIRMETRRRIFGDDISDLLFVRDEAMERYELDRLALAEDASLAPEDRAGALGKRRDQLRVELARLGVYVSFPDEARAPDADADAAGRQR